jgi:hypothetical protein
MGERKTIRKGCNLKLETWQSQFETGTQCLDTWQSQLKNSKT